MQKSIVSLADALDKAVPILPPAVTQQTAAAANVDIVSGRVSMSANHADSNQDMSSSAVKMQYKQLECADQITWHPGLIAAGKNFAFSLTKYLLCSGRGRCCQRAL